MQIKRLALAVLVLSAPAFAQGVDWYVRQDGGTHVQCNGKTNAAYAGGTNVTWIGNGFSYHVNDTFVDPNGHLQKVTVAGTSQKFNPTWSTTGGTVTDGTASEQDQGVMAINQNCAYRHPFELMNTSGGWTAFAGGDRLHFVDSPSNTAPYYSGERNNGLGFDWNPTIFGICTNPNSTDGSSAGCELPIFPSGTSGDHTQIIGQNAGSCHDSGHTHLVTPTILSGLGVAFAVLDVRGTSYIDISCVEVTEPDMCTPAFGPYTQCSNSNNYVKYGGIMFNYQTGPGPSNITTTDVAVVGLPTGGITGSHTTGTWTASDLYLIGNSGGFQSDGGGCNTSCESSGTWNITNMVTSWNGCQATLPFDNTQSWQNLAYANCQDQSTGFGLGDGFVIIASGALTVNVTHSMFMWNTQDGFDGLHISDDVTTSPNINISTSHAEGNEGAQFKVGGGLNSTTTAINNYAVGNCRVLGTASNFPLNPTGWNTGVGLTCRAAGDDWSLQSANGTRITLENNTTLAYGATMFDVGCAANETDCMTSSNPATLVFKNNLQIAYADPSGGAFAASFFFGNGNPMVNSGSNASYNLWFNNRSGCPVNTLTPTETNYQCGDPHLVAETNINAANPNLTSSSTLATGNGTTISGVTTDYNGNTRPSPPAIGAFEFATGATVVSIALSPTSASLVQGLTYSSLVCTATYSDSSTAACTSPVWSSATTSVATINSSTGVVTGVAAGTSVISATASGFTTSPTSTITVTAPVVSSIAIAPTTCSLAVGATCTLACTATFNNSTTAACTSPVYTSATPAHATVNSSTGVVTGVAAGASLISAVASSFTSNNNTTTVTATAPQSASISGTVTIQGKATQQ